MTDLVGAARAFAEDRHRDQRRKDAGASPYVTHVAEVAALTEGFGGGVVEIAAAWLHDTVEDCPPTSHDELAAAFGAEVAAIVGALTDDKSLPKAERKRMQVVNAPSKSSGAALVKICDKISNCRAVAETPPVTWSVARRLAYLDWSVEVVTVLPPHHPAARAHFDGVIRAARARIAVEADHSVQ
ncbi:metal dependent phosphohydrolase [Rhodovulum sp. ES.010]|uniref:HD domain-containing protein n=1 Tax=Rhodovulum sp. ES.010 TaxID=1882821 RepID=UPI000926CCFE|nr:HD domain-containing protein [Rhodovulum sp. ES.010]SIO41836.1 metal dependent phosphohydrolase [Rhodovulum sp. ES.010]